MTICLGARESTGLYVELPLLNGSLPIDISGWTFEATFERQAGDPDFDIGMALTFDPAVEGFYVTDGVNGRLSIAILPATLQAVTDTTGLFTLRSDLLGTPPGGPRQFLEEVFLTVTKGPTE